MAFGGEVEPSDLGHAGAGSYVDEVFALNCDKPSEGWEKLTVGGQPPAPRAWLAGTPFAGGFAVYGGNGPDNVRFGDMYILS